MKEITVLVIEDEFKLLKTLSDFLKMNHYQVILAEDGLRGMEMFREHRSIIDIVLLDIMMPFANGYEVLNKIRSCSNVPVIVFTAKSSVEEQLEGFSHGADDYITKPCSLSIVLAHIEAILKRAGYEQDILYRGNIKIDIKGQKVYLGDHILETTPKEFVLLQFFMEHEEQVLTRENILDNVWGYDYAGDTRTVDTLVKQLRKKLGDTQYIRTVYGFGYIFGVKKDV